ncbi:MAG: sulfur carrier protein ThiS [Dehalococcoidia bacterium]
MIARSGGREKAIGEPGTSNAPAVLRETLPDSRRFRYMTTTQSAISIHLNGEEHAIASGATVADLLLGMGLENPRGIAVAVNDEVVRKGEWPVTRLAPGDRVEVITALQGG